MTLSVNPEKAILLNERIEDIHDLGKLKKYCCPKNKFKREWFLECIDCPSKKTCKTGQQAVFIMENQTVSGDDKKIEENVRTISKKNMRDTVIHIFEQPDPVFYMLNTSGNIKPQSICSKVSVWRKNCPDLDEKYHMLDLFRFLWTKPYDRMSIPEILKELYPEGAPEMQEVKELPASSIAPNSKIFSVKPNPKGDEDSISLEDFLAETDDQKEPEPAEPPKKSEDPPVSVPTPTPAQKKPVKTISLTDTIKKLKEEREDLQKKISEIDKQIHTLSQAQEIVKSVMF